MGMSKNKKNLLIQSKKYFRERIFLKSVEIEENII